MRIPCADSQSGFLPFKAIASSRRGTASEEQELDRYQRKAHLRGCYLAIPTIYAADLNIDFDGMQRHIRFMLEHGLRIGNAVILVNGAAGEFPCLTLQERKKTTETAIAAAEGRIAVIVGAQTPSTQEAIEIARHAQESGAAALQVSPPYYYPPTDDDVYHHFLAIAEAAPDTAIVAYNTYWLGYDMGPRMVERLSEIPQVTAVKWGSPDYLFYQLVIKKYAGILGIIDNQLLPVFNQICGGIGANLHPAMYWPEWGVRIWDLLESRQWELAQSETDRVLLPYYEIVYDIAQFTGGEGHIDKIALELIGLPGGPNRPPTRPLPAEFRERLHRLFIETGTPMNRFS